MRKITALVLAHLAASPLLVACQKEEATPTSTSPTTSATTTGSADPMPSASAVVTATATASAAPSAIASVTPSATATHTAPPTPSAIPGRGASCKASSDCKPGLKCVLPFDGAHVIPNKPGTCIGIDEPVMGGRPLVVDGVARVASAVTQREWHDGVACVDLDEATRATWRAHLERAALEEHASVPAFARTICQLVALGAPAWLVEKTQRALADEIVHARRSFEWVERLGGGALGPGPLPQAVSPFGCESPDEIAVALVRDAFRGGCVGETLAAHEAAERATAAPTSELRSFFETIADDEARHAALAFETTRWLASRFSAARVALDEERARFATAQADCRALVEPLIDAFLG